MNDKMTRYLCENDVNDGNSLKSNMNNNGFEQKILIVDDEPFNVLGL